MTNCHVGNCHNICGLIFNGTFDGQVIKKRYSFFDQKRGQEKGAQHNWEETDILNPFITYKWKPIQAVNGSIFDVKCGSSI